jgi:hypothetical protein
MPAPRDVSVGGRLSFRAVDRPDARFPSGISVGPGVTPAARLRDAGPTGARYNDRRFVVSGAAAIEATAPPIGLERRRAPQRDVAGRLHVVMRVQQDGRRCVNVRRGEDCRMAAL